jgi:hypothetical protein
VTVEEWKRRSRRRLLSSINNSNKNELLKQLLFHHHSTDPVSLSDASALIQFQITAFHSYLTHQLNISSSITTVTVDKITQSIASEINSNSGATFMSHLEQYADQYGGALIKAALENSHYETCSVSESSSSSSSSDSDSSSRDRENVFSVTFYQVTGNLIARIVVGIVGGIAILAMGIRCVVVRRRQNKNDREETTDSNTKNSNKKKKPRLVRVVPIENHDNSLEEGNSHGINNSSYKTSYGNSKSSKFPDPVTNDEAFEVFICFDFLLFFISAVFFFSFSFLFLLLDYYDSIPFCLFFCFLCFSEWTVFKGRTLFYSSSLLLPLC